VILVGAPEIAELLRARSLRFLAISSGFGESSPLELESSILPFSFSWFDSVYFPGALLTIPRRILWSRLVSFFFFWSSSRASSSLSSFRMLAAAGSLKLSLLIMSLVVSYSSSEL
jgi:hypothetical protein